MADLSKIVSGSVETSSQLLPSQEPYRVSYGLYPRETLGAVLPEGFCGSWAASYGYTRKSLQGDFSVPTDGISKGGYNETLLGVPGFPDIDFVPYSFRTNRSGNKGEALLGHPISFDVVGPTIKAPGCGHTWSVDFGANEITLLVGYLGYAVPSFEDVYGLSSIPDGGLYCVISFTGEGFPGAIPDVGYNPIEEVSPYSKFEIFRVTGITGGVVTFDESKLLSSYFTAPGVGFPAIRAVTFLKPKVTRLFAVPGSGAVGREQTFLFVTPETSSTNEFQPPIGDSGAPPADTWRGGSFDPDDARAGTSAVYNVGSNLPIPIPIGDIDVTGVILDTGSVQAGIVKAADTAVLSPLLQDQLALWIQKAQFTNISSVLTAGRVINIYSISGAGDRSDIIGGAQSLYGWFQILSVDDTDLTYFKVVCRRNCETDSYTGVSSFYGGWQEDGAALVTDFGDYLVEFTVHDPVSTLFTSAYVRTDVVNSVRLTSLIDPATTRSSMGTAFGDYPSSAGHSIFNTSGTGVSGENENPGSLRDLGFKVVLFPGKKVGPDIVPDYTRPIFSERANLDPTVVSNQTISIDYASGAVQLSVAPKPTDTSSAVYVPGGLAGNNNVRESMVLFASCVPYSMEPGQRGYGSRITGGSRSLLFSEEQADVYGSRVLLQPVISWNNATRELVVTASDNDSIPLTGFLTFYRTDGSSVTSIHHYRGATFSSGVITFIGVTQSDGGDVPVGVVADYGVCVRKNPSVSFALDTSRGCAKKHSTVSFVGARFLPRPDGSLAVLPSQSSTTLDDAYRSGTGSAGSGRVVTVDGGAVEAVSTTASATSDRFSSHFRANFESNVTNSPVGFDSVGTNDYFGGHVTRTLLEFATASTVFDSTEILDVTDVDEITLTDPGKKFHTATVTDIRLGIDLVELDLDIGVRTFLLLTPGALNTEFGIYNLDGTTPSLNLQTGIRATFYRVRFGDFGVTGTGLEGVVADSSIHTFGDFLYRDDRLRTTVVDFHCGIPQYPTGWFLRGVADGSWESQIDLGVLLYMLPMPSGATLDGVTVAMRPGIAGRAALDRTTFELCRAELSTGAPAPATITVLDTETEDGTLTDQSIVLFPGAAGTDNNQYKFFVRVTAGNDGGAHKNDFIYYVRMTFIDPGPRNY